LHDRVIGIANELSHSRTIVDSARDRLIETRKALVSAWMQAAEVLAKTVSVDLVSGTYETTPISKVAAGRGSAGHDSGDDQ
jgi:hypothetical protein